MDSRSNKMLNRLVQQSTVSIRYFSDAFCLSDKMIRKIIKELNEELEAENLPKITANKKGDISFESMDEDLRGKIKEFIISKDFYTYRLSPTERKTIVAMILLNQDDYYTAAAISEYIGASRNTVLSDIDEMKKWFLDNGMELESQVQKGYMVLGSEKAIREGILKLILLNFDSDEYESGEEPNAFQHLLLGRLKFQRELGTIRNIIKEAEKITDTRFSDYSFTEVAYELLIALERLSQGKIMDTKISDSILKSSKFPMSEYLFDEIKGKFGIEIPMIEKKCYVRCLRRKSYIKSSTKNTDEVAIPIMIGETIHRITRACNISFYLDFALYDVLVDHMKSAIYRLRNKEMLTNPFGDEIEAKYPKVFQVVRDCIKPVEEYLGETFKKDEISFLVMYFASMIEKNVQDKKKKQKVQVCIVGAMGRGTMQLLRTSLGQFDDIIEIVEVKASHEIQDIKERDVEMIISLVPFFSKKIPCVLIDSPVLKKDDLYRIRMMAMEIQESHHLIEGGVETAQEKSNEEQDGKETAFSKLLCVNQIKLGIEASCWEDGVRASGQVLYENGIVEERYIEAMVDVVKENGSYIVISPGFAIPHAEASKGSIKEGVSLIRLKHPVEFEETENNPVSYIAGLSLTNAESINSVIYNLAHIFGHPRVLERLSHANTEEEVYQIILNQIQ